MNAPSIYDRFSFVGKWWAPSDPVRSLPGELHYTPKRGARLQVHGEIISSRQLLTSYPNGITLIGQTRGNRKITLVGAHFLTSTRTLQQFFSRTLILDHHVESTDSYAVAAAYSRLPYLEIWLDRTRFSRLEDLNAQPSDAATYAPPIPIDVQLDDSGLRLLTNSNLHLTGPTPNRVSLEHNETLGFTSKSGKRLDDVLGFFHKIALLLCFAFRCPIIPDAISMYQANSHMCGTLLHAPLQRKRLLKSLSIPPLFTLEDIELPPVNFFRRWLQIAHDYRPSLTLFMSASTDRYIHVESRFLQLCHAIEFLSRKSCQPSLILEESDYAPIRSSIEAAIPVTCCKAIADSIRNKLRYANEPSLRNRIRNQIEMMPTQPRIMVIKSRKIKDFVDFVVDYRNDLTHGGYPSKDDASWVRDLVFLCKDLEIVLACSLLQLLGFTDEQVARFLRFGYRMEHTY